MRTLVAITGASGALYAQRLLDNLALARHEVHVVLSAYAQAVIAEELPDGLRLAPGVKTHGLKSMNVPFASGSNPFDAMVVIPCTMGTLGRIAHGLSEDVLLRAADVMLKERKRLILVPRETPISLVHVKNFELLLLAGATIIPANPSFYTHPQSIEQVVETASSRWSIRLWPVCSITWAYRKNSSRAGRRNTSEGRQWARSSDCRPGGRAGRGGGGLIVR